MQVAQLTLDDLTPWAKLLGLAFDRPPPDMVRVLEALHQTYPVLAWGVWDGATLAAQYSCLLRELLVPGFDPPLTVGFSINMAVHPEYRGRGLIKLAAEPVYEAVRLAGALAGVGFSNAQGVKVDQRSRGYGYKVVGRLTSTLGVMLRRPGAEPLELTDSWPTGQPLSRPAADGLVRFANPPAELDHRYAMLARRYRFAVWRGGSADRNDPGGAPDATGGPLRGVVAYRLVRSRGLRVASLLGAQSDEVPELVARWAGAVWDEGVRAIHTLSTPGSPALAALRSNVRSVRLPGSRTPYYLTVKPLGPDTPDVLFDFDRWDCLGGDVL